MGFIKFIIIVLIVYYAIRLISIYVFPFLIKRFMYGMSKKYQCRQADNRDVNRKKEGEVTIDFKAENRNNENTRNVGEYVDYEEIK